MFGLDPTPFDVRLVAFRIPIRVHPSFWLVSVLLGWEPEHLDVVFLWVMCLFASIIVHELGHALVAEALGWPAEIVLYFGGGLTFSQRHSRRTPWREIAVALAGPFAGFGLFGLVLFVNRLLNTNGLLIHPYRAEVVRNLVWINYYWGLVNLLPVLPLDGGNVCRSLLELWRVRDPQRMACQISVPVAGAIAAYFFSIDARFAGIMFAMMCFQNITSLQQQDRSPW